MRRALDRNALSFWLFWATLTLGCSTAAVMILSDQVPFEILAWANGFLFCAVISIEWKRYGDPITSIGIIAATGFMLFFVRPLTIISSGETTAGARADTRGLSTYLDDFATRSVGQVFIFFCVLFLTYYVLSYVTNRNASSKIEFSTKNRKYSIVRARILLAFTTMVGIFCALYLVQMSGGVAQHFSGVANRSSYLSGSSFLFLCYIPLQLALIVYILVRRSEGKSEFLDVSAVFGLIVLLAVTILSGGRGPIVVGCLLPLLLLKQVGPRPLGSRSILLSFAALGSAAIAYGIFVRDAVFSGSSVIEEFKKDPFVSIAKKITSGTEMRPFDSLIRLNEVAALPSFNFQNGNTYLATFAWFIPRRFWEGKPGGGGNTWFTSNYLPRFYGPERVETSLSVVGEAFANFGWFGVVGVGVVFALVPVVLRREVVARGSLFRTALTVSATPIMLSLTRGDAYQNISVLLACTVGLALMAVLVRTVDDVVGVTPGIARVSRRRLDGVAFS
ncbi:O-antigen polysaccharide polymerase Wzy [Rhodococcus sp. NPDC057014]|uniref:O-antigen polysaccharide polymerase Wzy n=1 Tax=Rhodococcus sp. NPDC057014 TaxID=3346000 RepID=UPI00362E4873